MLDLSNFYSIAVQPPLQLFVSVCNLWLIKLMQVQVDYTYFPSISSMSPRDLVTPLNLPEQLSGISSSAGYAFSM